MRPPPAEGPFLVAAIALRHRDDDTRLRRASEALDDLYELYRKRR